MLPHKSTADTLLPLLTMACMATCAVAGLAVGVYDIAHTSMSFEIPQSVELLVLRQP